MCSTWNKTTGDCLCPSINTIDYTFISGMKSTVATGTPAGLSPLINKICLDECLQSASKFFCNTPSFPINEPSTATVLSTPRIPGACLGCLQAFTNCLCNSAATAPPTPSTPLPACLKCLQSVTNCLCNVINVSPVRKNTPTPSNMASKIAAVPFYNTLRYCKTCEWTLRECLCVPRTPAKVKLAKPVARVDYDSYKERENSIQVRAMYKKALANDAARAAMKEAARRAE